MKQIKWLRVLAGVLLWLLALGALTAQTQKIGELYYSLDNEYKTAVVMSNSSGEYAGDIVIPETVDYEGVTYAVTRIGMHAFLGCTGLTSVTIPNSVTSIGYGAFMNCTGLTSIEIPASVNTVEQEAFRRCNLTNVTIADRETVLYFKSSRDSYGYNADTFLGCPIRTLYMGGNIRYNGEYRKYASPFLGQEKLETLTIGDSVTSIGAGAFWGCTGLTSVTIPNSVTSIGMHAFLGCTGLTSVAMPAVLAIGNEAFWGCTGLTSLAMPAVLSIGNEAFRGCTGLTSVAMPAELSIGAGAFWGCTGLTSVAMPAVLYIDRVAFWGCTGLTSVTIPNSVTSIGDEAFKGCTGLKDMVLGKSVARIGDRAFYNCINLISITSKAVVPADCEDDVFYNVSKTQCELIVPKESVAAYKRAPVWKDFTRVTGSKDLSDRIYVTALRLDPDQASLRVGERLRLHAVITPDSATEQTVTWSSSNKKVVTVDNDGYVMAVAAGETVVTARTTDGSNLSATCHIMVVGGGSGDSTAVEVPDVLKAVRVYADGGRIEVRGLPLGTSVTLSGVDGRLWYQTEAVTGSELTLGAPRGHVYVLRLNHTHSHKVYLP